jgi:hypothetical protein
MAVDCHIQESNFIKEKDWPEKLLSFDIQVPTRQSQQFIVSHHSFQSHD